MEKKICLALATLITVSAFSARSGGQEEKLDKSGFISDLLK